MSMEGSFTGLKLLLIVYDGGLSYETVTFSILTVCDSICHRAGRLIYNTSVSLCTVAAAAAGQVFDTHSRCGREPPVDR